MLRSVGALLLLAAGPVESPLAQKTLDRVRALQDPAGAIPDVPGTQVVNADSNFLYLLEGLLACGKGVQRVPVQEAVLRGLRWLAARQWGEGDALPGAFPDALPLQGPGRPLGSPPVAAVGASAARFVALVARLDDPPADLREAARSAWDGLRRWNLDADGAIWNCWEQAPDGRWHRRPIRYAADQADYLVGREGAGRLGFEVNTADPLGPFRLGTLALDASGQPLSLEATSEVGALAVLAFDGPPSWQRWAARRLAHLLPNRDEVLARAALAHRGDAASFRRLERHLAEHPLPLDRESGGDIHLNVTGFVLRTLAGRPAGLHPKPLKRR